MCVRRDLDSQAPNIITLLLNQLTTASGAADQLPSGATRQDARHGGTGSKGPGHLQPLPPSL